MTKSKIKASPEIEVLDAYAQSRIRCEMWLSSKDPHTQEVLTYDSKFTPVAKEVTWVPALFTAYREVIDNAIDEMVSKGYGSRLDISYNEDKLVFKIADNGRGIPITIHPKFGKHEATLALSQTFSSRNFDDDERGNARGLNGVGAAIVNFCSEWFKLDICRDGKEFSQIFQEGKESLDISEPLITPKAKNRSTGTTIEYKLSEQVFKHRILPESFIRDRAFEIALCYPTLKVYYNGTHLKALTGVEKTLFKNTKPINFQINEEGFDSRFWLIPNFTESNSDYSHSLVNGMPMFDGGTHVDAFRRNFYSGLIAALGPQSKKKKLKPNRSDISDGLLIYNITEMTGSSFNSQAKTRLINENCGKIITSAMDDPDFFKSVVRKNPKWVEEIFERCAKRTQKNDASEISKLARQTRKKKVEKLTDATGKNRAECVLLLAEGDSAISGSMSMRNPKIHGGLPLRGKVLNAHPSKISLKDAAKNEALQQIMSSIGLIPGQRANRHTLRYGKVYITCDADEDGKNISALLINVFYQFWPELFSNPDKPFIYIFETPLIVARKAKTVKYWYNEDYHLFNSTKYKGWDVTRAKGLAALKKTDWKVLLNEPKLTPIVDDGELSDALDLLFNTDRAADRREWIGK